MTKISERIGFAVLLFAFGFLFNGLFEFLKLESWVVVVPSEQQRLQWETLFAGGFAIIGALVAYIGAVTPYRMTQRKQKLIFRSRLNDAAEIFLAYTDRVPDKLIVDSLVEDRELLEHLQVAAKRFLEQMPQIPEAIFTEELDSQVRAMRKELLKLAAEDCWDDDVGVPARGSVLSVLSSLDRSS